MSQVTYVFGKVPISLCISKEFKQVLISSQGETYNLEAHE